MVSSSSIIKKNMKTNIQLKKIVASLKLLSLPYEEQVKYFPDFVDVPFEVLDTFYNAFLLLPQQIEDGEFNYAVIANLLRLNNMINAISCNSDLQNLEEEQFNSSIEWKKVREFAKEVLCVMNEPIEKPEKDFI